MVLVICDPCPIDVAPHTVEHARESEVSIEAGYGDLVVYVRLDVWGVGEKVEDLVGTLDVLAGGRDAELQINARVEDELGFKKP